jgi:putative toxin-antitoxin system antitoxin component (TIGR02293 family)
MTQIGEVIREARRIYGGDSDAAMRFLTAPHRRLGNRAPILVAGGEGGAQAVRELLAQLEEGAPA